MNRKFAALLLTAAIAPMGMASSSSAHGSGDELRISAQSGGFSGFVVSKKSNCHNGRKVTLYKKKGSKPNVRKDKKVGSDIATPNGDGSQYNIRTEAQGKFYAYTAKKGKCKALRSKVLKAEPAPEPEDAGMEENADELG
jgi:hypothetical protein